MQALTHEFSTPAAPAALYQVLATPDGVRAWWCKNCEIATEAGGTHQLKFVKGDTPIGMRFELTTLEPQRRVVWTCTANDNPAWIGSTLSWKIRPEGEGARLEFEHDGFAMGGPGYEGTKEGWPRFIESLKKVARGETGDPL